MKQAYPLIALLTFLLIVPAECSISTEEYEGHQLKVARGKVSSIDWVNSRLSIKWLSGSIEMPSDIVTFYLIDKAVVYKNGKKLAFVDVKISEHVKMHYYEDPVTGAYKVVNIEVLTNDANLPP